MSTIALPMRQRGVITIFISMIMLLLITLLITTAFTLSTTNLRAVGNVQVRDEAIAAAQKVIEEIILEDAALPAFQTARPPVGVDVNRDGVDEYSVVVDAPICVRATRANTLTTSSVTLPGFSAGDAWNTVWEISAVATDATTGASVNVVQGVRYLMTEVEKNLVCA